MRLVFATRNQDKIVELHHALEGLFLDIRSAADFPGVPEVEETGATLEENALVKARAVHEATGEVSLADDTGLEVDALEGAPGVRSGRFAGPRATYEENVAKLLSLMKDVREERRAARFRTIIAIVFPGGREELAEGICEGRILTRRCGSGGFGYDPVFYVLEADRTFAQMTLEEKGRLSHRGIAMQHAARILAVHLGE